MQPPGRNMRMREQPITTCQHMASALLPVVASRLATTPYVVRGLSTYQCVSHILYHPVLNYHLCICISHFMLRHASTKEFEPCRHSRNWHHIAGCVGRGESMPKLTRWAYKHTACIRNLGCA